MRNYLIRRLIISAVTIFGVLTLTFLLVKLMPGDAVLAMLQFSPKEHVEEMRHALGLDRPILVQYVDWLVPLITRLDLGKSLIGRHSISKMIWIRLPVTVELALLSILLGLAIALPLGILAARHRGGWLDYLAMQFSQLGQAVPAFWIGTLLFFVLGVQLQLLPSAGWVPLTESVPENLRRMIMPSMALALPLAANLTRITRSSVLEVLHEDYVRTAYAKGLQTRRVMWRHVLRNALIPVLTMSGVELGYLLGGAVIIEDIFQLPGIGKLGVHSLGSRDVPVIQGVLVFYATFFVFINLIVDLLYSVVDPRISQD
jgi:peptide/nickel transport system permease protein